MARFIHQVAAPLYIRDQDGQYREATPTEVGTTAARYIIDDLKGQPLLSSPSEVRDFLRHRLSHLDYEVFAVILLDQRHRFIEYVELFRGTIDGCSVHPREVIKVALEYSAAAVILAHQHPSGDPTPSHSDETLTRRLTSALTLLDIRVLDHLVVGHDIASMAELGLI